MYTKIIAGGLVGATLAPVTAWLAVTSAGAGHGHYEWARLLFPYSMLLTRVADNTITLPLIVLALVQFPLYGAIIGLGATKSQTWRASMVLLGVHALAAICCFSGLIPNFT